MSRSCGLREQAGSWPGPLGVTYGAIPRAQRPGDAVFVLSFCSPATPPPVSSRKNLNHVAGAMIFAAAAREHAYIAWL